MKKILRLVIAVTLLISGVTACDKDPLIPDTPIHNPELPEEDDDKGGDEPAGPEYPDVKVDGLQYPAPINRDFMRIAYFPSYRNVGENYVPDFIYESIDVACYAFAKIQGDYTVKVTEPSVMQALVSRAHRLGKKVLISFNGTGATFVKMTSQPDSRRTFVNSVMAVVNQYGLDGVDNDWEYPSTKDGSDRGNLELMKEFSNLLHKPGSDMLLTMAITPAKWAGSYRDAILDDLFWCVDWFNVMTYDDYSESVPGQNHSSMELLENAYKYYVTTRGLPPYKFVAGLPCYGRASGITQGGTTMSYSAILKQGGNPDEDSATVSQSSYSGGSYTIYYNGRPTIRRKVKFALDKSLGGYFFWEQGQDSYDDRSLLLCASNAAGR